MDAKSAIIINNIPTPSSSLGKSGTKRMVEYFTREGTHTEGGCDKRLTQDDIRLSGRCDVRDMVDYASREGRFSQRLEKDAPLHAGEVSGGLWGRDGVIDTKTWIEEVSRSGSHVMRSVVSVKREDACMLGLATKEDWQRAIRSIWDNYVTSWGVIAPSDIRWAAAYHVDAEHSLHCHIMTIDASGRWAYPRAPEVAHEKFVQGGREARRVLCRPLILRQEAETSVLRDWLCARMSADFGKRCTPEREAALLLRVREKLNFELPRPTCLLPHSSVMQDIRQEIFRVMPKEDVRILSYARSSKEVRRTLQRALTKTLDADDALRRAYFHYEKMQHSLAQMRGHIGIDTTRSFPLDREREAVKDNMYDLNKRMMNAALTAMRETERAREREIERACRTEARLRANAAISLARNTQYHTLREQISTVRCASSNRKAYRGANAETREFANEFARMKHARAQGKELEAKVLQRRLAERLVISPRVQQALKEEALARMEMVRGSDKNLNLELSKLQVRAVDKAEYMLSQEISREKDISHSSNEHPVRNLASSVLELLRGTRMSEDAVSHSPLKCTTPHKKEYNSHASLSETRISDRVERTLRV